MQKIKRSLSVMLVLTVLFTTMVVTGSITTEAKVQKKTGVYSTALSTKNNKTVKDYAYAKKLVFKGKTFTVYGSMHYTKPRGVRKIYKAKKRKYIISNQCKFRNKGKEVNYKQFKKLVLPLKKGGYTTKYMVWVIEGGKVTEIIYAPLA
jgi:hypothetical protein